MNFTQDPREMLEMAQKELKFHEDKAKEWSKIINQLRSALSIDDVSQSGIKQLNEFLGVEIQGSGKNGRVLRNDYVIIILKKSGRPMSTKEIFQILKDKGIKVSAPGSLHTSMRQDRDKRFTFNNGTWTLADKESN